MRQVTYSLECNQYRKNYGSILNPLFNFMDSTTLLTWLDLRSIVLDVGQKYTVRLYLYTSLSSALITFYLFGALSIYYEFIEFKYVNASTFYSWQPTVIIIFINQMRVFIPAAYLNEQTEYQIKQFNEIRHFLQRMIVDQDLLMMPANELAETKITSSFVEDQMDHNDR